MRAATVFCFFFLRKFAKYLFQMLTLIKRIMFVDMFVNIIVFILIDNNLILQSIYMLNLCNITITNLVLC